MDDIIVGGSYRTRILNGLVEEGILSQEMVDEALVIAKEKLMPVEEILIEEGFITKERLESFLEKYFEMPRVDLSSYVPDPEALKYIPKQIVHKYLILPLFEIEGVLTVAIGNPLTLFKLDELRNELNIDLDPVLASEHSLIDAIVIYYGVTPDEIEQKSASIDGEKEIDYDEDEIFKVDLDRLAIIEGEAVNQLLIEILLKAKKAGAKAVHIEPVKGDFRVMFRINGELVTVGEAARSLQKPLLEQIKYLARISRDAALPQEKITELPRSGESLISIYPSVYGERIVITFLEEEKAYEDLRDFGFEDEEIEKIHQVLERKDGLVIIGAPIQSGKTSLLRALLKIKAAHQKSAYLLGPEEVKPIEGVQFQKLRGDQLLSAIEGIAYQDVDVVGIDELDSNEAYKSATRLSRKTLTIVTIEASNVANAISKFIDAGVEPFSLSWTLKMVVSLRLLQNNCQHCLEDYRSPLSSHKLVKKYLGENPITKRSQGCEECDFSGYKGYLALPELLIVKESAAQRIATSFNEESFYNYVRSKSCPTPLKKAFEFASKGLVSLEEIYRKTGFKE